MNCITPKGRTSIFLFCEFSEWIHLTDSSAFQAQQQDFQEEGSPFPVRVIKHLTSKDTTQPFTCPEHRASSTSAAEPPRPPQPRSLCPSEGLWHNTSGPHIDTAALIFAGYCCKTSNDRVCSCAERQSCRSLLFIPSLWGNTDDKAARREQLYPPMG